MISKHKFLGLSFSSFSFSQLRDYIINTVLNNNTCMIYGHSFYTITNIRKKPAIYTNGEEADLHVADGHLLFLLAKMHRLPLKYEISIPNLVLLTLQLADEFHWSVFLLGAEQGYNSIAIDNIRKNYPGIKRVEGFHGFYESKEENEVFEIINYAEPNVLLIGMPSPYKEYISVKWRGKLKTNIIIPCGGMINVIAGKTRISPKWIKKMGLASIYRLLLEPKTIYKRLFIEYSFIIFRFIPFYLSYIFSNKEHPSVYEHFIKKQKQ